MSARSSIDETSEVALVMSAGSSTHETSEVAVVLSVRSSIHETSEWQLACLPEVSCVRRVICF